MSARQSHLRAAVVAGALVAITAGVVGYSSQRQPTSAAVVRAVVLDAEAIAGNGNAKGNGNKTFQVAGHVVGLYPGAQRQLTLAVSNPHNFAIKVTSLSVVVGPPGVTGCAASNVVTTNFVGSLIVPKDGTATKILPISMQADAPDQCQGVTFPLTFGGKAEKA